VVALQRALDAVHAHVRSEANGRVGARERVCRSRRPLACWAQAERGQDEAYERFGRHASIG
jgi:hypothetical protein